MNKPFLIIAGSNYYPEAGTGDWIGFYSTLEEAKNKIKVTKEPYDGKKKYMREFDVYEITTDNGIRKYDWCEIVDLRNWTE